MKTRTKTLSVTLVLVLGAGCATTEENEQALGATLGAVAGGAICAIAGGNTAACLASAAGGALVGWGGVKAKQVMEQRTALAQNVTKPSVTIRSYRIDPSTVTPGQAITVTTTYDLLMPKSEGSRPVTQTFTIQSPEGKQINTFTPMEGQLKEQGRYEVGWEVPIPNKAPPGRYRLVQQLDAGTASPGVRTANFEVVKRVAFAE